MGFRFHFFYFFVYFSLLFIAQKQLLRNRTDGDRSGIFFSGVAVSASAIRQLAKADSGALPLGPTACETPLQRIFSTCPHDFKI